MSCSFQEFCALVVGVQDWAREEEFREEADEFLFKQQQLAVDKKQLFLIELKHEEKVEYSAEQLVHFYRTKDMVVREFLSTKTAGFKKISVSHRSVLGETIAKAAAGGAAVTMASAAPATSTTTATDSAAAAAAAAAPSEEQQLQQRKSAKRPQASSSSLQEALKLEVRYYDRNAALNATRSFQEVIDIDSRSKKLAAESASSSSATASTATASTAASLSKRSKRQKASSHGSSGSPIIIVPSSSTCVINMYNCRQFLEDNTYVSYADLVKQNGGQAIAKPESVYITRSKHPLTQCDLRFKVVDSVLNFTDAMWDRVVAVIVSGQAWQLKGWKWPTTQEIFANVKGLFVFFDDAKLPTQIQGWNVSTLAIKRHLRNKDIVRVHELWSEVDAHLAQQHPKLLRGLIEEAEIKLNDEREARKKGMQALLDQDAEEEEEEDQEEEGGAETQQQQQPMEVST